MVTLDAAERGFLGRGCKPQDTFCSNERYSDQNSYCTSLDDTKAFLTDSPNQDLETFLKFMFWINVPFLMILYTWSLICSLV